MRVFGAGLASWRMPQFICGNLAILILSWYLIRNGHAFSGVVVPAVWAGDRSLMELLYGRPDGIAALFLVIAFLQLSKVGTTGSAWRAWASGFCIGMACGFHLTAAFFVFAGMMALAICTPLRRLPTLLGYYLLGGMVPLLAILDMWSPSLGKSFEQLLWHVRLPMGSSYSDRFVVFFQILRWSRYWVIGLLLAWVACGVFAVRLTALRASHGDDELLRHRQLFFSLCFLFGAAGAFTVFSPRALLPYYLIYFSYWPIVGMLVYFEDIFKAFWGNRTSYYAFFKTKRYLIITLSMAAVLVMICWIPSLAWNLMRFRESILYSNVLQPREMVGRIHRVLPRGTEVCVDPWLVSPASDSELDIVRLQWDHPMDRAQNGDILLLTEEDYKKESQSRPAVFLRRPILFRDALFPDAGPFRLPIIIFGSRCGS
jgi:hypothetical protein